MRVLLKSIICSLCNSMKFFIMSSSRSWKVHGVA